VKRGAALLLLALAACGTAHADDPAYDVRVAADQTVELGATAAVSIAIVPGPGRTISADGPIRIAADAGEAIGLPRRRYLRRDAADPAADAPRFDVRVKARQAGEHTLALDVRFWLCQAKTCRPVVVRRDVVIRVPAPPIDAGVDAPPPDAAPLPDAGRVRPRVK
jgi:hypothetical protein